MAQKKSQVQNFEKAFDYTLFLGKYLPTFKCSSQNSTSVDTLQDNVLEKGNSQPNFYFQTIKIRNSEV